MKKHLIILGLCLSLFWESEVKAAETPLQNTKVIEALVNTFSFNTDGTFDITNVTDLTLTGDLNMSETFGIVWGDTSIKEVNANDLHIFVGGGNAKESITTTYHRFSGVGAGIKPQIGFVTMSSTIPGFTAGNDTDTGIGFDGLDGVYAIAGGVTMMGWIEGAGTTTYTLFDFGVGTTTPPTAGGGKVIYFGDNAGDPTMDTLTSGLYGTVTAGVNELTGIDSDGNVAPVTSNTEDYPVDMAVSTEYPYVTPRKQVYAGIRTVIAEHKAMELLQDLLRNQGLLQPTEFIIKHIAFAPTKNWEDSQEASRLRREQRIQDAQGRIAQLDAEIAVETKPDKLAELQNRRLEIKVPSPHVKRNPGSQWLIDKGVKLQ